MSGGGAGGSGSGVQKDLVSLFSLFRGDPTALVESGMFRIMTAYGSDDLGGVSTTSSDFIQPFNPTAEQRRLNVLPDYCRRNGYKPMVNLLKSRQIGASTNIQARFASKLLTCSGVRALTMAHKPNSARNIYQMSRDMLRNLDEWLRPEFLYDSKELIEIALPRFGIKQSKMCVFSSTGSFASIHGQGFLLVHESEVAYFENADEIHEALSAVSLASLDSEVWKETTAFGHDPYFHPEFMSAWASQRGRNYWERGARMFKYPSASIFFPWHQNTTHKILPLVPGVTVEAFVADLDEYERDLLKEKLLPFWTEDQRVSERVALEQSVKQLHWRRAKIPFMYPNLPLGQVLQGSTLPKLELFNRQEPATVEEAFATTAGKTVLSPNDFAYMEETVRAPVQSGWVDESGAFLTGRNVLRVWEGPGEAGKDLIASIDPVERLAYEDDTGNPSFENSWKRDFTCMTIWKRDDDRLTQVAEYHSQECLTVTRTDIYRILRWYWGDGERDEWPFVVAEQQKGTYLLHYLRSEMRYPLMRMARKVEESDVKGGGSFRLGFHTNASSKRAAVEEAQIRFSQRRIVVRSARILEQARFFVEKQGKRGNTLYQAAHKGAGTPQSKDDAIWTVCMACHQEAYARRPRSVGVLSDEIGARLKRLAHPKEPERVDGRNIKDMVEYLSECYEGGFDPSAGGRRSSNLVKAESLVRQRCQGQ